jgi:hypothetical protein
MAMALILVLLAALIQVRGQPLNGGRVSGSAVMALERAAGGDTPVLSFTSDRGPLRLLLDTGAASTMVTPELVRRLRLTSSALSPEAFTLAGGGHGCGALRPRRTRLPDLDLGLDARSGGVRLLGVEALVLPGAALPPEVDGVLGAPTLRRLPFWVDPQSGRLAFGAAALGLASSGKERVHRQPDVAHPAESGPQATAGASGSARLRLRWHRGVPLLDLRTPLGVMPALADSGAEGLFLSSDVAARLPLKDSGRALRLVGFCGEQAVQQNRVAGLRLAEVAHSDADPAASEHKVVMVIITSNPIFRLLGVEAIVGQELLRQRQQLWRLDLQPPVLELR